MIFNNQIAPGRNAAIRAGWNDAAWGRPHREVEAGQEPWYERGYSGGLVFRQQQQPDLSERTLVSRALPRVVPATLRPNHQPRAEHGSVTCGYGRVGDIVVGIVGAIVGGYVGGLILGHDLIVTGFNLESVVVAFVGAVVLIAISRMLSGRRGALTR